MEILVEELDLVFVVGQYNHHYFCPRHNKKDTDSSSQRYYTKLVEGGEKEFHTHNDLQLNSSLMSQNTHLGEKWVYLLDLQLLANRRGPSMDLKWALQ